MYNSSKKNARTLEPKITFWGPPRPRSPRRAPNAKTSLCAKEIQIAIIMAIVITIITLIPIIITIAITLATTVATLTVDEIAIANTSIQ